MEVDGVSARFSGDRIESESDSVPEMACCDVATLGPRCFCTVPRTAAEEEQKRKKEKKKWTVMSACAIETEGVKAGNSFEGTGFGEQIEGCVGVHPVRHLCTHPWLFGG